MKILICTDLEGVSGVTDFRKHVSADSPHYSQSQKLLTAEVNAAIEGMIEAGVKETLVIDGHGTGGICFEQLHPKAKYLGNFLAILRYPESFADYDAIIMIGQHAMAGTADGNLCHTQNFAVEYYKLNNRFIGEIAQCALFFGSLEIPLIFVSGDAAACREANELIPGICTAAVKHGISKNAAICLSPTEAHNNIKEAVKKAIENFRKVPMSPLKWQGPFVMIKKYLDSNDADYYIKIPSYERLDERTLQVESNSIREIIYA